MQQDCWHTKGFGPIDTCWVAGEIERNTSTARDRSDQLHGIDCCWGLDPKIRVRQAYTFEHGAWRK